MEVRRHLGMAVKNDIARGSNVGGQVIEWGDHGGSRVPSSFPSLWPKPLFGDLGSMGFVFEWVEFDGSLDFRGGGDDQDPHLSVCLNLEGQGSVVSNAESIPFHSGSVWVSFVGRSRLNETREAQTRHRFLNLRFAPRFLTDQLPTESGNLHPIARQACQLKNNESATSEINRLSNRVHAWVESLRNPPVLLVAQPVWYRAKAIELACELLFVVPQEELFCHRQQRLAEERAAKVKRLLQENLTEPPSLKELGRKVGCSPYYLSRTFSREVGMTIPQYLRQIRIERAAELLQEGRFNVTEVALEVGYSSISHFSHAFCQMMGSCPAMYKMKKR